MRITPALLAPLLALGACEGGEDQYDFGRWDVDGNDEIDFDEFTEGFGDTFDRWDESGDGIVDVDELAEGLFSDWDRNRDDSLATAEFGDAFFGGGLQQLANFDLWDADRDTLITRDEFVSGWQDSGIFEQWDQDGEPGLSVDELANGLFGAWDADTSDGLDQDEFGFI